jgi:hypothetical protein
MKNVCQMSLNLVIYDENIKSNLNASTRDGQVSSGRQHGNHHVRLAHSRLQRR